MLEKIDLSSVLFLDIETVSGFATYGELNERFKKLWQHKCRFLLKKYDEAVTEDEAAELYPEKAGIYAEFGKIVCISVGLIAKDQEKGYSVRLKSFQGDDEQQLLKEFSALVSKHYNNPGRHGFCGHNLKEFDIPFMCRRMLVNQLPLPNSLDISGKKPWETKHFIDTLELWKFGDYKNYTSLSLLTALFEIPSPKDDIDGSEVGRVYWEENDLNRIAVYCEKDVLAVIQLLLRYKRLPLIPEEQIFSVTEEKQIS